MMVRIRALPRGFDTDYAHRVGENVFCAHWDTEREGSNCDSNADIELDLSGFGGKHVLVVLCRKHATSIAHQILDAVQMVDGRDLLEMGKEP